MRRAVALVLIGAGLALIAVLAGGRIVDSQETAAAQAQLATELPPGAPITRAEPRPVATPVPTGRALLTMRIPRFGADWKWVVSEGTSATVLAGGPGHYSGTALPGERGNTAFAGHRAGHGDPFINFDQLRAGDRVVLQQGANTWVYQIDGPPRIIPVSASWVLDPTPGRKLTLTTCWPKYGSSKRMYVRAHLVAG
ncbi:MAG: Integral rane protein [Nocardioides sp.]|nr:Integral rane protein [Nocardioides sp.]